MVFTPSITVACLIRLMDLSVFVAEFADLPGGLKPSRIHAPVADRQGIRYGDYSRRIDRDFV
jgi:hypothetical protein